jgi:hypothetical protein
MVCFLNLESIPKVSPFGGPTSKTLPSLIFFVALLRIEQMVQRGDTRFASAVAQKLWRTGAALRAKVMGWWDWVPRG